MKLKIFVLVNTVLLIVPQLLFAGGPQLFGYMTQNPAAYKFVESNQFKIGTAIVVPSFHQRGTIAGVQGSDSSGSSPILGIPQFRLAHRFSDKIVVGIDVTTPGFTDYPWKQDSFSAIAGYDISVRSISFVPKMSYELTDTTTLGVGIGFTQIYDLSLNNRIPNVGSIETDYEGWAYNFQLGLIQQFAEGSFLDFSFFYKNETTLSGNASFNSSETSSNTSRYMLTPSTFALRFIQFLSPKWAVIPEVDYSMWSGARQKTTLKDVPLAGNVDIPLPFKDTFRLALTNRYDFTEKLSGFLLLSYDFSAVDDADDNSVALPRGDIMTVATGGEYSWTDHLDTQFLVGSAFYPSAVQSARGLGNDVKTTGAYYFTSLALTVNW